MATFDRSFDPGARLAQIRATLLAWAKELDDPAALEGRGDVVSFQERLRALATSVDAPRLDVGFAVRDVVAPIDVGVRRKTKEEVAAAHAQMDHDLATAGEDWDAALARLDSAPRDSL